jgi:hypothetical protein
MSITVKTFKPLGVELEVDVKDVRNAQPLYDLF